MFEWYLKVLQNYANFQGRARRKEYWYFTLAHYLIFIALVFISELSSSIETIASFLFGAYYLATVVPSLAVTVRRLHDTGRSGWNILLGMIPLVGGIILLVFLVEDSNPGANKYGDNPKEEGSIANDDISAHLVE